MKNVNYWIFPTKVGRKQPQARSLLCRPSRVEACCAQERSGCTSPLGYAAWLVQERTCSTSQCSGSAQWKARSSTQ